MSFPLSIPFYNVQLKFETGGTLTVPLMDNQVLLAGASSGKLAEYFKAAFQKKIVDKGNYTEILSHYIKGDFYQGHITIDFPASKDKMSFPAFELEFPYLYKEDEYHFWGIIPTMGLDAMAENILDLESRLEETIRLEFARNRRLNDVRRIVSASWYSHIELKQQEVQLKFHTPNELEKVNETERERLLPQVAKEIAPTRPQLFGMKSDFDQLVTIIKGQFNRSILLVGKSGVGKTTMIWELARQLKQLKINGKIWETTASTMIKELTRETGWEDNLVFLCKELSNGKDVLFVRNLLELFEVGQYVGNEVSIAHFLKSYLSRGEIVLITECTDEEYAKIELKSPNYLSLLNVVRIEEPSGTALEEIIVKKVESIAKNQKVSIDPEAIMETLRLNRRFTPYAGFPGKPIRFLESILLNISYDPYQVEEHKLERKDVIKYFCEETGMPQFMIDPEVPMSPKSVKVAFKGSLFGQDLAVDAVVDMLASVKTALTRTGKPIASFLFVGPTGVGKTEMAKNLAEFMFASRERMLRFDMSEYATAQNVMRLIGESYHVDGVLTSAVRREPFSVLLFDEIEKASPVFYDLLLQILGEGRLTDSRGKLVNFCSTIIIMTSNIGATRMQRGRLSFRKDVDQEEQSHQFMTAVQQHFRPELYNRIDQVISFASLDKDTVRFVVEREIDLFKKREGIAYRRMDIYIEEEVYDYLAKKGYNIKYGARYLQRALREELIVPLAYQLNIEEYDEHLEVRISMKENEILILTETDPLKLELLLEELARDDYAEHSSELRRDIYALQEGNYYIKMTSDLARLERARRKKGDEIFFKDKKRAENYNRFKATIERVGGLSNSIADLEMDLSLAIMGEGKYRPAAIDDIKVWKQSYLDLKLELYERIRPSGNAFYMGIYGSNPKLVFDFYEKMIQVKGFQIRELESLWFRESSFNERIEFTEKTEENGLEEIVKVKRPREEYLTISATNTNQNWLEAQEEGDLLVGIKLKVVGRASHLYFRTEFGLQEWAMEDKKKRKFNIVINQEALKVPIKIHRKQYYDKDCGLVRRFVSLDKIRDVRLKINREYPFQEQNDLIRSLLDEIFRSELNKALV